MRAMIWFENNIEPDLINKAANKRIDQYTEALVEAIKDPIGVVESVSQTISDTYEEEGIMYVTGKTACFCKIKVHNVAANLA